MAKSAKKTVTETGRTSKADFAFCDGRTAAGGCQRRNRCVRHLQRGRKKHYCLVDANLCAKHNFPLFLKERQFHRWTMDDFRTMDQQREWGWTYMDIAKKLGCTEESVGLAYRRWLRVTGRKPRKCNRKNKQT